ncbi:hypothetical protein [Micromonospora sp. URMC 103]|uniref:hypothetical protein n=1 Tax=Micromonospora sp. URMC 103 TaxID=3423406 RepID=UPI003F1988EC
MPKIERAVFLLVALVLAVCGVALVGYAWSAWDPLPPGGPALGDSDRIYEVFFGLIGGIWIAARVARRMLLPR